MNVLSPRPLPRHVYLHVPFCVRRCSYCDFAIAVRRRVPVDDYVRAVGAEIAVRFPADDGVWEVDTIYLGGGTPSLLGGVGIERLMAVLRGRLHLAANAEVTLEANPDDIAAPIVAAWRAAGVTRLSIGAQSFDPRALAWMHRTHTADRTREAIEVARTGGLDNVSLDLIFALPSELQRSWTRDLEEALALRPAHLSLYGLTVEPRTPLGRWVAQGAVVEADEAVYEEDFLAAHEAAEAAGYEHYEVSNFALPGARSRHNGSYWSGASYAGLGPGAHEYDGEIRRWNIGSYAKWSANVLSGRDPVEGSERLGAQSQTAERVYLGLRTSSGTVLERGEDLVVDPWVRAGWARRTGETVTLTPRGWLRLDSLAISLASKRSR